MCGYVELWMNEFVGGWMFGWMDVLAGIFVGGCVGRWMKSI